MQFEIHNKHLKQAPITLIVYRCYALQGNIKPPDAEVTLFRLLPLLLAPKAMPLFCEKASCWNLSGRMPFFCSDLLAVEDDEDSDAKL